MKWVELSKLREELGFFVHNGNEVRMSTPLSPYLSNSLNGFKYVNPGPSRRETWVRRTEISHTCFEVTVYLF